MYNRFLIVSIFFFTTGISHSYSQVIASGLPGCLPVAGSQGIACGGGSTFFGINGSNQFQVQNIDGISCCAGPGGDFLSYFEFPTINISCYSNISISMNYSSSNATFEDNSPLAPIFGCQGTIVDNSHDQIVFTYSLNGGPEVQSLYVHGVNQAAFTGVWNAGPLNGNTLRIRIYASNKASDEIFYFQNLMISGTSLLTASSSQTLCYPSVANISSTCNGTWSGGTGFFGNPTSNNTTYTPGTGDNGMAVVLTFTGSPVYPGCPIPSKNITLTYQAAQNPNFSFADFCAGASNGPTGIVTPGGTFSFNPIPGGGVTINPSTGIIAGGVGGATYTVQYTTPGPCPDTHTEMVTVLPQQDATFTFTDFCAGATNGPSNIVTPGGTFSFNPNPGGGVTINSSTGVITGGIGGATYTVQYTTPGPCPDTHTETVMVLPQQDASFTFADFCAGATNGPSNIVTPGGTFSFNPNPGGGVTINSSTGVITGGIGGATYTVQYTTPGPCPDTHTETVMVIPQQNASFTFADFCAGATNGPTGIVTPGGTFSFNPNPGGGVTINPSTGVISGGVGGATYTVQYTTPGPCPGIQSESVMVLPLQDATFTFADFCAGATNGPTGIVTPGGTFSFNPNPGGGVTINPSTGVITGGMAGATYTVQYTTPGPCPGTQTESVSVLPNVTPTLTSQGPFCTNDGPTPLPTTQSGITGNWSGPGVVSNQFNPSGLTPGTYTLTFNPNPGQCAASNTIQVQIIQSPSGNLVGSPVICPGQCGSVGFQFSGGAVFSITLNFSAGIFNQTFTIPAATSATTLNFCYNNGIPFDPSTNTVNIPTLVPPGNYSLTLLSLTASGGGPCASGIVGNPGVITVSLAASPTAVPASLSLCDLDQNGTENFNLTSLNSTVNGGVGANTVSWFLNMGATNPISNPSNFSSGNATVYAMVTNPAGCTTVAPVALSLTQPVTLTPGNFTACVNASPFNLPVTVGGFNGLWSGPNVINGGTTFDPAGLSPGTYSITFSPTGTVCALPANSDVVIITGGPVPLQNPIETTCPAEGTVTLSNTQGGINGTWSGSPFLTGNNFNAAASGPGSFILTFTPDVTAGCLEANTTTLVVNNNVLLTAVNFTAVCQNSNPVSLGNTIQGYPGTWSGNPQVNANTFDPAAAPGNYALIFTPDDICAIGFTTSITVNAPADLPPPAIGPTCISGANINLPTTVAGVAGGWTYNLAPLTVFNPSVFGPGMFPLVFMPTAGTCTNSLTVTVTVSPFTAGNNISTDICRLNAPTVNLNSYLSAGSTPGGAWSIGGVAVTNAANFDLSSLSGGANVFNYILDDPACGKDTAVITFNVSLANNAGNTGTLNLCENNVTSVNFSTVLGVIDAGGTWTQPSGAGIDLSNLADVDLSSLMSGSYNFTYIIPADLCPADTANITANISQFNTAGSDVVSSLCLGSSVDLKDLLTTTSLGGTILNPNNIPGLTGSIWNTTGLSSGQYLFRYIVTSQAPCPPDTANINISLVSSVTAGNDISDFYCQGQTVILSQLLSSNASGGGLFYINGTLVANGILSNPGPGPVQVTYVVGDGALCPKDTAILTLGPVTKPAVTIPQIPDICENDCQSVVIAHNIPNGAIVYLSLRSGAGSVYKSTENTTGGSQITLNICPKAAGPFSLTAPPLNQSFTFSIDSVKVSEGSCRFDYTQTVSFETKKLPERNVSVALCKGETLIIGPDVYSETKPSGITILPSVNPALCDSLIRVNVTFGNPSPETKINRTTCDQNFSVTVGNQTFDKNNPLGMVLLKNKAGCDSLVSVDLKFNTFSTGSFTRSTCDENASFTVGNQTFDKNRTQGMVTLVNASVFGCDSIVDVNITYLEPAMSDLMMETCDDAYTLTLGGTVFNKQNPQGQVLLSGAAANGCDSLINVDINYLPKPTGQQSITTCDDKFTLTVGGLTLDKNNPVGIFTLPGAASNGCDSTINVSLTFISFQVSNTLVYNCDGSDAMFTLGLASLPGPFVITVDGNTVAQNQNLPYSSFLLPGSHVVRITSPEGCIDSLQVNVDDTNEPDVELTQTPNLDGSVQLNVVSPPNVLYNLVWDPDNTLSCNNCTNPVANPSVTTTYTLQYNYSQDCEGTRYITVEKKNADVVIPNVFSPDGNGSNDVFYVQLPEGFTGTVKKMAVYDRWGNLLFLTENVPAGSPAEGWNGTSHGREIQPGVYVFLIELLIDGESELKKFKGDITIIR